MSWILQIFIFGPIWKVQKKSQKIGNYIIISNSIKNTKNCTKKYEIVSHKWKTVKYHDKEVGHAMGGRSDVVGLGEERRLELKKK